jgi:acyl-CoA thioester hydrolase
LGNHIYYARYLNLLEEARGELFREAGIPLLALQEQDLIFPVLECHLHYRRPARYDDQLEITTGITSDGPLRVNFCYRIINSSRNHEIVLEGETLHICASIHEKPKRLPPHLRACLEPFVVPKPLQKLAG